MQRMRRNRRILRNGFLAVNGKLQFTGYVFEPDQMQKSDCETGKCFYAVREQRQRLVGGTVNIMQHLTLLLVAAVGAPSEPQGFSPWWFTTPVLRITHFAAQPSPLAVSRLKKHSLANSERSAFGQAQFK